MRQRALLSLLAALLCTACTGTDGPPAEDARLVRTGPTREPIVYGMAMTRGVVTVADGCVRLLRPRKLPRLTDTA